MFWKPGTTTPGAHLNEFDRANEGETQVVVYNKFDKLEINQQRVKLPIYSYKDALLYLVENYSTVVIVGSTGCGKTTQIPQYLHEVGWTSGGKLIGITQPRRVAAASVAKRVAEEMGVILGQEVGYNIRFDDCTDPNITTLKYMTDGMLLREMMLDPLLKKYSVIMLDEAHERSLYTDILVGLLKKVQRKRPELRIIVSSATVDAEEFKHFFNGPNLVNPNIKDSVAIMSVPGRLFPVDIFYREKPTDDYITASLETLWNIHYNEPEGHVLIFLTGQEEIDKLIGLIRDKESQSKPHPKGYNLLALPIYSGLPGEKQVKVFKKPPQGTRKVIVATNIAETSITIDDVAYVIDCGFVKIRAYNPKTDTEALVVVPASQSSANQRSGRAGRVRPGKCFRLYTEDAYLNVLPPNSVPEMQRSNLAFVILQLKAMGIENVLRFEFMSPPPAAAMSRALELLYALGALNDAGKLTSPLGEYMTDFPLEPPLAKMLISSGQYKCTEEILSIISMLNVQNIFTSSRTIRNNAADAVKRRFAVHEGDHITLLNVFVSFMKNNQSQKWCQNNSLNFKALQRALDIRNQLEKYVKRFKIPMSSAKGEAEPIVKCILSAYFHNAAQLQPDATYKTLRSNYKLSIHPSSVLFRNPPPWLIFHEVIVTNKEFMRDCTAIQSEWLEEVAPHFYETKHKTLVTNPLTTQKQESGFSLF
eukprot:TRINITY_DN78_c0_g1_i1.p1 TRINITY_DN78_c0_g1~~TRINITY_DN78_c0_g1_i1.p1  ORF type:complete len:703 (+),score=140.58 TRINITY_DN78_c0_g1_i1:69-2177(+)